VSAVLARLESLWNRRRDGLREWDLYQDVWTAAFPAVVRVLHAVDGGDPKSVSSAMDALGRTKL